MNWWGGGINLFVTEEEKRACLCGYVGIKDEATENVDTVGEYLNEIVSQFDNDKKSMGMLEEVLTGLNKRGIGVVTITWKWTNSEYAKDLSRKLAAREHIMSGSLDQWNRDMEQNLITCFPICLELKNGTRYLPDTESKYLNVCGGKRKTFYQPQMGEFKRIYFFGPCYITGRYVKDEDTIESYLQQMVNEKDMPYIVENCGTELILPITRILAEDIKAGDIVVYHTGDVCIDDYLTVNTWEVCEKNNISAECFTDHIAHCNATVNKAYAEAIYDTITHMEMPPVADTAPVDNLKNDIIKDTYLNRYFTDMLDMLKSDPDMKIGSIVMNANPFTLGHRYLIEQAAGRVDYLIVFVVEEDLSTFSFLERWWLVKEGTKDMANVKIVPSGDFVLSNETFPGYFIKEVTPDIKEQTEYDINLFADAIAKPLGIKYRFVGEELTDEVTRQYNEAMKKILPSKGIEVVEIKRKECAQSVISASTVRRMLENGECEKLADFVPETTREYVV